MQINLTEDKIVCVFEQLCDTQQNQKFVDEPVCEKQDCTRILDEFGTHTQYLYVHL